MKSAIKKEKGKVDLFGEPVAGGKAGAPGRDSVRRTGRLCPSLFLSRFSFGQSRPVRRTLSRPGAPAFPPATGRGQLYQRQPRGPGAIAFAEQVDFALLFFYRAFHLASAGSGLPAIVRLYARLPHRALYFTAAGGGDLQLLRRALPDGGPCSSSCGLPPVSDRQVAKTKSASSSGSCSALTSIPDFVFATWRSDTGGKPQDELQAMEAVMPGWCDFMRDCTWATIRESAA
jgi:hypothetical protein